MLGQGLIMNIYYSLKQGINVVKFWIEILKMSLVPIVLSIVAIFVIRNYHINNWNELIVAILIFCVAYTPFFWLFGMNKYERGLIKAPFQKIMSKIAR